MARTTESSIIAVDKFIQATRDSGYKGTDSAIAELVDNALQAGARRVMINVTEATGDRNYPLRLTVLDDGCGMDHKTLRQALRFGGTSRFNDRSGLGRYGMGLPNSSLSQARRVDVYSWRRPSTVLFSYLDVDDIARGRMTEVPNPIAAGLPSWTREIVTTSGTLVVWSQCDRLDHRRLSTIVRKLSASLGRIFRFYLWNGVKIQINGIDVQPLDPLYLHKNSPEPGATVFCEPIQYSVEARSSNGLPAGIGTVTVTFSELPVHKWHDLPNDEKRQRGITNGAGVSVVRANREIDYGWFFMGRKRRENYDDWWRCEIRFDPILDEVFGITHTKQQIRPQEYLLEILSLDMENMAKALNARVRQAHLQIQASERVLGVERIASERDRLLKPLPRAAIRGDRARLFEQLAKRHPSLAGSNDSQTDKTIHYRIVEDRIKDTSFYTFVLKENQFILVLNPDHPFYRKVYKPLLEAKSEQHDRLRSQIDLLLLAAARAEAEAVGTRQGEVLAQMRKSWSDNVATFLNG